MKLEQATGGMRQWGQICWFPMAFGVSLLGLVILVQGMAWFGLLLTPVRVLESEKIGAAHSTASSLSVLDSPVHRVREWEPKENGEGGFGEAPRLSAMVQQGKLPEVGERIPGRPMVIVPHEQHGPYGEVWTRYATGPNDIDTAFQRISYESLVRWDPFGREILPNLASSWDVEGDGTRYVLHLRRGVRWSNGEPFSSEDILFWYRDVLSDQRVTPVPHRMWRPGGELVRVEQIDDYTVSFEFTVPNGLFIEQLASGMGIDLLTYPRHYLRDYHPAYVSEDELNRIARAQGLAGWYQLFYNKRDWRNTELPTLAAWRISRPPPRRPVVFERNPYYWKVDPEGNQLPYIDEIHFHILDPEIINLKAISGELDMQMRHINFSNYSLLMEHGLQRGFSVRRWIPGRASSLVLFPNLNHRDPVMADLFNDRRFRQALSVGFDRNVINSIGFFDLANPRQPSPPPSSPFYCSDYESAYTQYDPELANRLLDAMGLDRRDSRGVRLRPDGRPLRIELQYYFTDSRNEVITLIATYWRELGIQAEAHNVARDLVRSRISARRHDIAMWSSGDEQFPLFDPRVYFPSTPNSFQALLWVEWFESDGRSGEEPPEPVKRCMELYREIERTVDASRRIELFQQILDLNREHLWVIGTLGEIPELFVVGDAFRNVPEKAIFGWIFRTPGNTAPECYAIGSKAGSL